MEGTSARARNSRLTLARHRGGKLWIRADSPLRPAPATEKSARGAESRNSYLPVFTPVRLFYWKEGGGVAPGMPTLEQQEVSAPPGKTCLRSFTEESRSLLRYAYQDHRFRLYAGRTLPEPTGIVKMTAPSRCGGLEWRRYPHQNA
jgi:hypothetical protein